MPEAKALPGLVRFEGFELDLRSGELRKNGADVILLPEQSFQILKMLLEHPGEVVGRRQIQERLWPDGTIVEFEHSISAAINRLRQALGDAAENPRYIETLSRRGYRFIPRLQPVLTSGEASIAVLPFTNMSADPENEFFADGITEEIINTLTQIEELRVAARTSAFSFKGKHVDLRIVGERLNVKTVLEGSVRKAGNRIRIMAQLINIADGYHLWGERYDRELKDIFEVPDDIARAITSRLKVTLKAGQQALLKVGTSNLEAYQLYPTRMSFARHSSLTDLTQRSAYEFKFGLLGGKRSGSTFPDSITSRKDSQNFVSRSCSR
jgi:TolB-like protein